MQIKNTMRYHLTLSECLSSRKQEITSFGKDVEKWEILCTVGDDVNWFSH